MPWAGLALRSRTREVEPVKETGMSDYRLDERGRPTHHPAAVERLKGKIDLLATRGPW
jgi:hypothetical protein